MRELNFLDEAESNLIDIAVHIANESGSAITAINYTDKIREHCEKLAEFPGTRGTERPELKQNLRSIPFENYVVFFEYREKTVDIVAVIEGHRDMEPLFHSDETQ